MPLILRSLTFFLRYFAGLGMFSATFLFPAFQTLQVMRSLRQRGQPGGSGAEKTGVAGGGAAPPGPITPTPSPSPLLDRPSGSPPQADSLETESVQWLSYWLVSLTLTLLEGFLFAPFLVLLPASRVLRFLASVYGTLRFLFNFWMAAPQFKGALWIQETFLEELSTSIQHLPDKAAKSLGPLITSASGRRRLPFAFPQPSLKMEPSGEGAAAAGAAGEQQTVGGVGTGEEGTTQAQGGRGAPSPAATAAEAIHAKQRAEEAVQSLKASVAGGASPVPGLMESNPMFGQEASPPKVEAGTTISGAAGSSPPSSKSADPFLPQTPPLAAPEQHVRKTISPLQGATEEWKGL